MSELATVASYDIPLVGVVLHDGAYGNLQRMHKNQFEGDHYGTELANPDFAALAASFDIAGHNVETPEQLEATVRGAIESRRPALIGVPIGITPDPWALITSR